MGMTTVAYRGRHFAAPDGVLEIVLHLACGEIARLVSPPGWLTELRQDWHDQATQSFGFGVTPSLDRWSTDGRRAETLASLFRAVSDRLEQSGTRFTGAMRDGLGLGGGPPVAGASGDYEVKEVADVCRHFAAILAAP